jgi:peptide-methionine (S)-S-oxide reductase
MISMIGSIGAALTSRGFLASKASREGRTIAPWRAKGLFEKHQSIAFGKMASTSIQMANGLRPSEHRTLSCGAGSSTDLPVAKPGDWVKIHYSEETEDGMEVSNSKSTDTPLDFILGSQKVVPGLQNLLMGLAEGQSKVGIAKDAEAYGEWKADMTAKVDKKNAPEGLKEGMQVSLQNGIGAVVTKVSEDFVEIDANHPLAGKPIRFNVELLKLIPKERIMEASFGGGCFWGVELKFQRLPGVLCTEVGYCNGIPETVTYEEVCSGQTGHVEVVNVKYDEDTISFDELIEHFFTFHDPTELNRQGNDVGTQYRSGIYCTTEGQKAIAEKTIARMQPKFSGQIVTEIEMMDKYNPAEEYHQQYLERGGRFGRPQSAAKGCNDPVRCYG